KEVVLKDDEIKSINKLIDYIALTHSPVLETVFFSRSHLYAQELPRRLRDLFYDFKYNEASLAILIKNAPFDEQNIIDTPSEYREYEKKFSLTNADIFHGLFSSLLGEPIAFSSQRRGHIINSIIPLKELENISNSSSGSTYDFQFHTEDAFHEGIPDYLGLICMRNYEKAPTVISHIQNHQFPEDIKRILFEEKFIINSNPIHENLNIKERQTKKSILFGNLKAPYLRINLNNMNTKSYSKLQKEAIDYLINVIDKNQIKIILEQGNCLYIDNFRTVHRRNAYKPLYGKSARWLTRIVTTNDLRKTRHLRTESYNRVIS
uniref:TauD/TfdA family dioxygenase n=1 Tax=Bizionia sp. TaxID=1954480 RepID=UPI003A904E2D